MSLENIFAGGVTAGNYLLSLLAALALGLVTALVFTYRNKASQSMMSTLVLLPAAVHTVILLVNGNLGIGVAVAGAFSLVRFRSIPGSARDIAALFIAMVIGLAAGTGSLPAAAAFTLVMGAAVMLLARTRFGEAKDNSRELKIVIPENLDYENLFDAVLTQYTQSWSLQKVRTTNMGSLYELTYRVALREGASTRSFLDSLRLKNGNLNITLGRNLTQKEEL